MCGSKIRTVFVIARRCEATREALNQWEKALQKLDLRFVLIDVGQAWKHCDRHDASFLIDGVDSYQLPEKVKFAKVVRSCWDHDHQVPAVFLCGSGECIGLSSNHSLQLHFPSDDMSAYYQHLAGKSSALEEHHLATH